MLTDDEKHVLELLAAAWTAYVALPDHHTDDVTEARRLTHAFQEKVMARVAQRAHPDFLT